MQPKKSNTLPYILGSMGLIVVAIIISSIVNRSKNPQSSQDIRSRASAPSLVKVTGTVNQIDEVEGTILVDNLQFEDSTKSLGTWTVTPPLNFQLSSVFPDARITITVSPPTMLAETRTLTATEITISR